MEFEVWLNPFKEKIVMHMICALYWWDVQLQSADLVGLWWAWGFDGRRREHSGLPWLWFLSPTMVWSSCCASNGQLSVAWSLELHGFFFFFLCWMFGDCSSWICFNWPKKTTFIRCKVVYVSYTSKSFFATLTLGQTIVKRPLMGPTRPTKT